MPDTLPSHRYLSPPDWAGAAPKPSLALDLSADDGAAGDPSAWALREAIAERLGGEPSGVYVASDGDTLVSLVCRASLPPDGLLVLAEPEDPAWTREALVCGARYVDVGRDHGLDVHTAALERVLGDHGADLVVLGMPSRITGTSADHNTLRAAAAAATSVVLDARTALDWPTAKQPTLLSLPGTPLCWLVAAPELVAYLGRLRPSCSATAESQATALRLVREPPDQAPLQKRRKILSAVLRDAGFEVTPSASATLFTRLPGREGPELAAALATGGLAVATNPHHSWRESVRVAVPDDGDGLTKVAMAFRKAAEALSVLALVAVVALFSAGCGAKETPEAGPRDVPAKPKTATEPVPVDAKNTPSDTAKVAPPGVGKELHRAPLVGGCQRACKTPEGAFTGFVAALGAPDRHVRAASYVDTTRLEVDGADIGARLRALAGLDERSPRIQAVAGLMDELHEATGSLDEGALIDAAHRAKVDAWPREATALLSLPGKPVWKVELARRGLEWLVWRITRQARP